jgi:integrase/recombinase XerD
MAAIDRAARRCLPVAAWPAGDRAGWLAATAKSDLLLDDGPIAHLRRSSQEKLAESYGRWLNQLAAGNDLDPAQTPGARATPDRIAGYLAALQADNAPRTVLGRLTDLLKVLRLLDPDADTTGLRHLVTRLRAQVSDVRDKRARLRGADELLALGHDLMRQAEADDGASERERARRYRDGLMIALLAARPLRLQNFVDLTLGRHLVRRGPGWWLEIPGPETKTGEPIDLPFPDELAPALETYLATWRRRLAAPAHVARSTALWLTQRGTPISAMHAYLRISELTRQAFGRPVNPHLFRDAAATTIAITKPEQVRIMSRLLGHRSLTTAERYYNLARGAEAATVWHQALRDVAADGSGRKRSG